MKKINSGALFPFVALTLLVFAFSQQMFEIPPLGKLLEPFAGAVQNEESQHDGLLQLQAGNGLKDSVRVFFDERRVPHIYAKNTVDMYFAQGYVTASLRLWQMDFITYASAGRLSELFPKKELLEYDRNQRRIGILEAARHSLELIEQDTATNAILTAYTAGVNAYIRQLHYRELPLEYKLLDYKPEPWTKLKSVLVSKSMANSMTGYEEDLFLSKMMLALGEDSFNKLYPDFVDHTTPVMNANAPAGPLMAYNQVKKPEYLNYSFLSTRPIVTKSSYNPALGSNSWAVSGEKTKSGHPILANDPHLNLSMPCVWLELQMSSPGVNVYGVSIPGSPAVIIGFNENIAWGITNGADDVRDWYKLKISNDYKKYEYDGKWLDLSSRIEVIKRRGLATVYDTIYSTIHGPIVFTRSFPGREQDLMNNALKWELHNPSNEFRTFIKLSSAANYQDYREAISQYSCPLQNFTFACKDNTIAINHQGKMAERWPGQGKFILDGTSKRDLYTRYISTDSLPQLLNPACHYVLSANQHPTFANYPHYYHGYYSETRANRIGQLLDSATGMDIGRMKAIQLDNTNTFAVDALPVLLASVQTRLLNKEQQQLLAAISQWKGNYDADNEQAELYELWWKNVRDYTWDEFDSYRFFMRMPEDYILLNLIGHDPSNKYFDKQGTAMIEQAGDIVTNSFAVAADDYLKMKKKGKVSWSSCNKINVMHLTNMPALSVRDLASAGHPTAINAMSANWGPSWRMIVELGDRPVAYGVYPGGQSGNPGSRDYDSFIKDWNKGNYYQLHFYMSQQEAQHQTAASWLLK